MLTRCVYLRMELCLLLCYSVDWMLFFVLSHEPHSHTFMEALFSISKCFLCNIHTQSCSNERIGSNPGLASFPLACRLELPQVDSHPLWLEGDLHLLTHNHPNMYCSTYWICRYMHDGGTAAQKRPAGGPVCRMWPVRKFLYPNWGWLTH